MGLVWAEPPELGEHAASVSYRGAGEPPHVAEVNVVVAAGEVTQLQLQLLVSWVQVVVEPQHPAVPVQLGQ